MNKIACNDFFKTPRGQMIIFSASLLFIAAAPAFASPKLKVLHTFDGSHGSSPKGGLVQAMDGLLYGTTPDGGSHGLGTIYRLSLSGQYSVVHNFGDGIIDGGHPSSTLIIGRDGALYGTSPQGGAHGYGTVFRVTMSGEFSTLYSFSGAPDGASPSAGLIQGTDGNFYGTTGGGGEYGIQYGTVFKVTPEGAETVLHSFSGADGYLPQAGLVEGPDGNLYGVTVGGGEWEGPEVAGTAYKISKDGRFTLLHSFCRNEHDGCQPAGSLIFGPDGYLYGATNVGGRWVVSGAVFRMSTNGDTSLIASFGKSGKSGSEPFGPLIFAGDGSYYGTTWAGSSSDGSDRFGTIFNLTAKGELRTIYGFSSPGLKGGGPVSGVIEASDGNLYGTATYGGADNKKRCAPNCGVVFRVIR